MIPAAGTYRQFATLRTPLPPLVAKQRRLAAQIASVADAVTEEKTIRGEIDQLLIAAGLQKGQIVTCAGYDVRHNERDGQSSINGVMLTTLLIDEGIDAELIDRVITAATDTGEPSKFATVTPTKGAIVRPPAVPVITKQSRRARRLRTE